ncbi:uncharacterized protein LOC127565626 [Drosophila albomicans]|uniref:Uncharacterized protein LOC127565626 n=1 Tax=Drosophila albomicans TaxID=7291 RepID=A0A9C6T3X9_DROAB|nr:uncharacterized protein LOC127565626 [Drosophila albomicans]
MSFLKTIANDSVPLMRQMRSLITTSVRQTHDAFKPTKHNPSPTCQGKGKSKKKSDEDCVDDHPKPRQRENIQDTFPFYHLIKFKDVCCGDPCIDKDFATFDECLYKESDKNKRKYQVTWVECPPVKIQPKKICCFAKAKKPPVARRKPVERPDTACKYTKPCPPKGEQQCPRIKMPRCRPVRVPVRCHRIRWPSECRKVKTPYPAFSECARPKLRVKRRTECECHNEIPMCALLAILNRRLRSGSLQLNPCGK